MRAHASKWKAVYLSLHLRDCGMHAKILKKRASGNITTISHLFTRVDKNVTAEIQLKSVYASVNEKPLTRRETRAHIVYVWHAGAFSLRFWRQKLKNTYINIYIFTVPIT